MEFGRQIGVAILGGEAPRSSGLEEYFQGDGLVLGKGGFQGGF